MPEHEPSETLKKTELIEGSGSPETKRDELYEKIDQKIDLIVKLYNLADDRGLHGGAYSEESVAKEKNLFENYVQTILSEFPDKKEIIERYDLLRRQSDDIRLYIDSEEEKLKREGKENLSYQILEDKYELIDQLIDEINQIYELDDDTQFVIRIRQGLKTALEQREKIRDILQTFGEDNLNPEKWSRFLKENYPNIHREIFENIVQVIPDFYSIHILINRENYNKYYKSAGFSLAKWQFPINIIKSSPINQTFDEKLYEDIFYPGKSLDNTLRHEDLHSFLKGFGYPLTSRYFTFHNINKIIERIKQNKRYKAPSYVINVDYEFLKKNIQNFIDYGQEELMAEIVSIPHPDRTTHFPSHTFTFNIRNLLLLKHKTSGDEKTDTIVNNELSKLENNLELFLSEVRSLYISIYKKYQNDNLYKLDEIILKLDCALMLFPPSKIRHVRRWLEWKLNSTPTIPTSRV